jgi:uncharacterized protein YwgA
MLTQTHIVWNKIALLAIIDASFRAGRNSLDNVEIQKLSFLTEIGARDQNLKAAYFRFYREKFGPYSTSVANAVTSFEKLGLINQENRELRDRGRYLLRYARPDIEKSETAMEALRLISDVSNEWKDYRGWSIKEKVYELDVAVQGLGGRTMTMPQIPLYIEIVNPETAPGRDITGISPELVADICAELAIPSSRLDADSEEVWAHSLEALKESLAR